MNYDTHINEVRTIVMIYKIEIMIGILITWQIKTKRVATIDDLLYVYTIKHDIESRRISNRKYPFVNS